MAKAVREPHEGKPVIHDLVKQIVAQLAADDPLMRDVKSAVTSPGVVSGEFGFAELHAERKVQIGTWLDDANERVRAFAATHIVELERWIAAERRAAEGGIALRKLDYGEEIDLPEGDAAE